ncbi:ABC transporter ATP-binding protein [Ihubacter sp. rT4E-8]|uniref:ABC transporter ATP-binding protein n=1 Tax=unclassified Ihubacter TaxID=2633299 RepID=UPI00137977FA
MKERELKLVENPPIVQICGLCKAFGSVTALKDVNVKIPEGRIIGLLGANGSGKTTLLKILAGLYTNYDGEVLIDGQRPGAESKAKVSYLPDRPAFSLKRTAEEIKEIYRTFFDDFDQLQFKRLMDAFEIGMQTPFREMSKGMIDKVQISFAMSRKARLYLLDEPLGGVDAKARDSVLDVILENFDSKGTILVATHLISEIERLFDSVVVLREGQVVMHESCDAVRENYGSNLEEAMKEIF